MYDCDEERPYHIEMLCGELWLVSVEDIIERRSDIRCVDFFPAKYGGLHLAPVRYYSLAEVIYLENDQDELMREYVKWLEDVKAFIDYRLNVLIVNSIKPLATRINMLKEYFGEKFMGD